MINGVMDYMKKNPKAYDLRKIFQVGIDYQIKVVKEKIEAVGSKNKS